MVRRPRVIAFDVIETLFPLEPLRARIVAAGQPGHVLELWFTRLLRDAFALTATGDYRPFADIAAGALASATGHTLSEDAVRGIMAGFAELDPHPDVAAAFGRARQAGVPVITVTNGSPHATRGLLERAGVLGDVRQVLSVDDIRRWKPAPDVYHYAARACQLEPGQLALVAAHSWDIHGAHQAGLVTGWVSRLEGRFPPVFAPPDVAGAGLVEVVDALLEL